MVAVVIAIAAVAAPLVVVQQEAYLRGAAFYSQIDEDQQALISQVLSRLQNRTADRHINF